MNKPMDSYILPKFSAVYTYDTSGFVVVGGYQCNNCGDVIDTIDYEFVEQLCDRLFLHYKIHMPYEPPIIDVR